MSSFERDRFGQRPLYYAVRGGRLFCADRVSSLCAAADLPRALDPGAAAAALCGALPLTESPFRGVSQVPPGWQVEWRHGKAEPSPRPGSIESLEHAAGGSPGRAPRAGVESAPQADVRADAASGLLATLRAGVARMAPGAACALSGGLDSGLLLALMSEGDLPARAYTLRAGFGDEVELRAACLLAARSAAEHSLIEVDEDVLPDHFAATVHACETTIWNGAAVARLLFFREVRRCGESALLSGVGADELLCGNPAGMAASRERSHAESELGLSLLTTDARGRLLERASRECEAALRRTELEQQRELFVTRVLAESTLPPECRSSAAEGVEVLLPYLDAGFATLAMQVPAAECVREGQGKLPLREAARGLVPDEVRTARKTPRLAPSGGGSQRARARWLELFSTWLRPERLEPLACVDGARAQALLERFAQRTASDHERAVEDAVLLRLVSLAILASAP